MKYPLPLVLASTSVYRRQLLRRIIADFTWAAPGVDEAALPGESARALVARLARAKADTLAERTRDAVVVGSDQVAVLARGGEHEVVLGKPGTAARCCEQLTQCSGRQVAYITAVAVVRRSDASVFEFIDTTQVNFRDLDPATIERYVARESPLDCAGGFKSEGLGVTLCESIDSADPTALIGLPLIRLSAALRSLGFELP